MECGGAETEIKAGLLQHGLFERCSHHGESLILNGLPKEGCEAIIGLYGNEWFGTQLE